MYGECIFNRRAACQIDEVIIGMSWLACHIVLLRMTSNHVNIVILLFSAEGKTQTKFQPRIRK